MKRPSTLSQDERRQCASGDESRMSRYGLRTLSSAFAICYTMLREIFDENAYARVLAREKAARSRESYARFQQEMACRRERRARCC